MQDDNLSFIWRDTSRIGPLIWKLELLFHKQSPDGGLQSILKWPPASGPIITCRRNVFHRYRAETQIVGTHFYRLLSFPLVVKWLPCGYWLRSRAIPSMAGKHEISPERVHWGRGWRLSWHGAHQALHCSTVPSTRPLPDLQQGGCKEFPKSKWVCSQLERPEPEVLRRSALHVSALHVSFSLRILRLFFKTFPGTRDWRAFRLWIHLGF